MLLPREPAGEYSSNRLIEWIMAAAMLLLAVTFALPGDTLERGALRLIAEIGFDELALAVAFAIVGTLRCGALFANGKLPVWGPLARYAGSFIGALAWLLFMLPLALDSVVTGRASAMVAILGPLILGELLSCYRAIRDSGLRRR